MQIKTTATITAPRNRQGFTLVEMLVSVTLVLLMMTMFAAVLQMATESVSKQQVISENDQKARALTTVIRSDFLSRTMRYSFPFYPGEDSSTSLTFKKEDRDGYIYISTNAPDSSLDDVIQFTVHSNRLKNISNNADYFGRAAFLVDTEGIEDFSDGGTLYSNPNQPEADDENLRVNETGSSPAAEVAYFVRNGKLYRRVVLLRDPLPIAGNILGSQPMSSYDFDMLRGDHDTSSNSIPEIHEHLFQLSDDSRTNDYWQHFDYAAHPDVAYLTDQVTGDIWAKMLGVSSLNNSGDAGGAVSQSLGIPIYRWGFNPLTALPREHDNVVAQRFIGRYLHAETSAENFNFPQSLSVEEGSLEPNAAAPGQNVTVMGNGNPYDIQDETSDGLSAVRLELDVDNDLVDEFDGFDSGAAEFSGRGGTRRTEDLLLSNVHEFRVEIWDERYGGFVTPAYGKEIPDPGDPGEIIGDYHVTRSLNPYTGPWGSMAGMPRNCVFDTWHPDVTAVAGAIDFNGNMVIDNPGDFSPPFIPYNFYPPKTNGTMPQVGPTPAGVTLATENKGYWQASTTYDVGDVVFTEWTAADDTTPADGAFQYVEMDEPKFILAYRAISGDDVGGPPGYQSGLTDTGPSATSVGQRIEDGELIWESFDNRRPLKAARLTIRYINEKSNEPRQLTLVLPLSE